MDNELHALDTKTVRIGVIGHSYAGTQLHEAIENAQHDGMSGTRILIVDNDIEIRNICRDKMMNDILAKPFSDQLKLRRKAQRKRDKPWNR